MLGKLNTYFKRKLHALLPNQSGFNPELGLCCISISPNTVDLAHALYVNNQIELQFLDSISYESEQDLSLILPGIVTKHDLEEVSCAWILQPEHYQLLSLDALPVSASEFQAAIRWKIKSLLSYPITDAVIDSFPMPQQNVAGARPSIMAVVARASYLKQWVAKFRESGFNLTIIEIPELALRNVTALYENDGRATALIHLAENHSQLIITREKELFLQRHFNFDMNLIQQFNAVDKTSARELDKMILELQRSFDYYQSQWRHSTPGRIFIAATTSISPAILEYLSVPMVVPLQVLHLQDVIRSQQELTENLQGRFLSVIGGALRIESPEYATTN